MLRRFFAVVSILVLAVSAFAQNPTRDYTASFNKGVELLRAGKHDEGIAAFKRCIELVPQDPTAHYNLACGYSLKKELDPAFESLNKAADLGFGNTQDANGQNNIDFIATDKDLDNVRADPRYAAVVEKMKTMRAARTTLKKKGEEYAAKAAIYVPEKVASMAEKPILVVCHDAGSTKEAIVAGRWKAIADQLGMVLIAPSGTFMAGDEPAKGMRWFESAADYVKSPWRFSKTVNDAVTAFKKENKVDAKRVVVVGEGDGGVIAMQVGVDGPGLYKSVVAVNAPLVNEVVATKATQAGKMGLKVKLLVDPASMKGQFASPDDYAKSIKSWNQSLSGWSLGGVTEVADAAAMDKAIVDAIQASLTVAAPVEAAAPTK